MGRAPCCDKNGLKKGPWTTEEDQKLVDYIQKHGYGSWRTLPKNAGLQRCGKSCRLRWTNYLRPDIKRGRFSFEEEETIIQLHSVLGNKWSAIAARLPGRTDNEIKNYWNTHIRKRLLRMGIDPVTHSPRLDLLDLSAILNSSLYNNSSQLNISGWLGLDQPLANYPELLRLAASLFSCQGDQNRDFVLPNLQENQNQNQFPFQNQIHELQNCTATTACTTPFSNIEAHLLLDNVEQFQANTANLYPCQPDLEWENAQTLHGLASVPNYGFYSGSDQSSIIDPLSYNSNFHSSSSTDQSLNFASVLSTPSSSPTPLNSSSTYVTGSTEDERESYCSSNNVLKFEIPDIFGLNEFM
ncbi:hypothetical protein MKW94_021148 [Papaver nudicaule]|uniref:Uncharacterized protein n=1 Tax=Papaver nudicaule TaxID=74823 RepID=A0AA41V3K1_PAPNU|nr:hypothetical protein [Papaver nudicaule]